MKKKIFAISLAIVLLTVVATSSISAAEETAAETSAEETVHCVNTPALAEKYGVMQSELDLFFPDGIPQFLTDSQVNRILDGEGMQIEHDDTVYTFNATDWYAGDEYGKKAYNTFFETDYAKLAREYGLNEEKLKETFRQNGVPDFMSPDQIQAVMDHRFLRFDVGDTRYDYNFGTSEDPTPYSEQIVEYSDLSKKYNWYDTALGSAAYNPNSYSTYAKSFTVKYFIKTQDSSPNRKGRAWCAMQINNNDNPVLVQKMSETINYWGEITATSNTNDAPDGTYISYPNYIAFSFRNFRTDTKLNNVKVVNSRS